MARTWRLCALPALACGVAAAAPNNSTPVVTCPSPPSPLATTATPALTTLCQGNCGADHLCVYYPSDTANLCGLTPQHACLRGDKCAFECVPTATTESLGWFVTLYDDPAVVADVVNQNFDWFAGLPDYQTIALNASIVRQWIGPFVGRDVDPMMLFITGNEPANNNEVEQDKQFTDALTVPKGDIVPFVFPPTFFSDVRGFAWVRIENLPFPALDQSTANVSFDDLSRLFLRNTNLTSFPFPNASFPYLEAVDVSFNTITQIAPRTLPDRVSFVNVSFNSITSLENGSMPKNISVLDIRANPLKDIPKGTLPARLEQLWLMDTQLTKIPADVAAMQNLTALYLDANRLGEIPDNAIPSHVETLSLENCGLTAMPKALQSMTHLKELWLPHNDLSRHPNFSVLPKTLNVLMLENTQLQSLPADLKNLKNLNVLDLTNNPKAMSNLSALPSKLRELYLDGNALDAFPPGLNKLRVDILSSMDNPLGQIQPGSLPTTLISLAVSNASFRTLPSGTLPPALRELQVMNTALETVPPDLRTMTQLTGLELSSCRLSAFDEGTPFRSLEFLILAGNRITSFNGTFPTLVRLILHSNSLREFSISAPGMIFLDLGGNNLTTFPDSIFEMTHLRILNLTGNPIRNFTPTAEQAAFLGRIQTIFLDQEMFKTDCEPADRIDVAGYTACLPATKTQAPNKSWQWLVPLNVGLAIVLSLLVFVVWRRHKFTKQRRKDLALEQADLQRQQQEQTNIPIWADTVLLKHRLDEDLIERKRLLGSGSFGDVWLATYKDTNVALKRLKQTDHGNNIEREQINDFVHEIKLLSNLSHPSVVAFVGVMWTKESDLAMVTEYMDGGDLRSYLDHHPKIDGAWTAQTIRVALHVSEAIAYLHSLAPIVIHRDLKSRNVLLDKTMRAKLSDFGISRFKLDDATMTAGVGTVRWIAPEVLAGQRYDESVDVYSLGAILSEMDTHKLPFEDLMDDAGEERLTDSAIAGKIVTGKLRVSVSPSCPSEIQSLVARCAAFDARQRPTARQVADELRAMLEGSSTSSSSSVSTASSGLIGSRGT